MNKTLALLPLMIAMGLAHASEPITVDVTAVADSATAVALEASAKAQAELARANKLTDAEKAKLQSELDAAQQELGDLSRRIAELSVQLHDTSPRAFAFQYLNAPKRALIGVVFDADDTGVKIIALTPNGPAAKAGIQVGDRLISVNGTSVPKVQGGDPRMAVDAARTMFGDLEDGQAVAMVVERAGKTMTFTPKAERRQPAEWSQLFGGNVKLDALRDIQIHDLSNLQALADLQELKELKVLEGMPDALASIDGARQSKIEVVIQSPDDKGPGKRLEKLHIQHLNTLNLSSLNPELGKYFGTDRGILVLENDPDMFPKLKAGDVIQVIDGQPADSVTDVMRVIGKKSPGDIMNVEVFRDRQRQVISMEAPKGPRMLFREDLKLRDKALPLPPKPPAEGMPPAKPPMPIPAPKGVSA